MITTLFIVFIVFCSVILTSDETLSSSKKYLFSGGSTNFVVASNCSSLFSLALINSAVALCYKLDSLASLLFFVGLCFNYYILEKLKSKHPQVKQSYTLIGTLKQRYPKLVAEYAHLTIAFFIITIALEIATFRHAYQHIVGMDSIHAHLIVFMLLVTCCTYTIKGGYRGVLFTDYIQLVTGVLVLFLGGILASSASTVSTAIETLPSVIKALADFFFEGISPPKYLLLTSLLFSLPIFYTMFRGARISKYISQLCCEVFEGIVKGMKAAIDYSVKKIQSFVTSLPMITWIALSCILVLLCFFNYRDLIASMGVMVFLGKLFQGIVLVAVISCWFPCMIDFHTRNIGIAAPKHPSVFPFFILLGVVLFLLVQITMYLKTLYVIPAESDKPFYYLINIITQLNSQNSPEPNLFNLFPKSKNEIFLVGIGIFIALASITTMDTMLISSAQVSYDISGKTYSKGIILVTAAIAAIIAAVTYQKVFAGLGTIWAACFIFYSSTFAYLFLLDKWILPHKYSILWASISVLLVVLYGYNEDFDNFRDMKPVYCAAYAFSYPTINICLTLLSKCKIKSEESYVKH